MKKEVYCGFDMEQFNHVRDTLDKENITHTHKVIDLITPSCMMERLSGIRTASGANTSAAKAMKQYYIYVLKDDYEKVQMILRKER